MIDSKAAAQIYLQQIQAHDLSTAMPRIHHDLQMDLNSYKSYFELLDIQLNKPYFPARMATKCSNGLNRAINKFQHVVNILPQFHEPQSSNYGLVDYWEVVVGHDLRSLAAPLIVWADLVEVVAETAQPLHSEALKPLHRLTQAMKATATRLRVITDTAYLFNLSEGTQNDRR